MQENRGIVTITIDNGRFQTHVRIVGTLARGWNGIGAFGVVRFWTSRANSYVS